MKIYKCIYTGRRLTKDGKVYHRFESLPEREDIYYRNIRGVHIGYTYECGKNQMSTRPKRCDDERIDNPEWESNDALVDTRNMMRRADAKIKRASRPALKKAIEALQPLLKGLNIFDQANLIKYLCNEARGEK